MLQAMVRLEELTRNVSSVSQSQAEQSSHVGSSLDHLNTAAGEIQKKMQQNKELMKDFDRFITSLGDIIKRNSQLVKGLTDVS